MVGNSKMLKKMIVFVIFISSYTIKANIIGSDFEIFNPNTNGLSFLSIDSGDNLKKGRLYLGLTTSAATNTIARQSEVPGFIFSDRREGLKDAVVSMTPKVTYGLTDWLQVGLEGTAYLSKTRKEQIGKLRLVEEGFADVRGHIKLSLFSNDKIGLALLGYVNKDVIEDNPFVGDPNDELSYTGLLALGITFGRFEAALNGGYRYRDYPSINDPAVNALSAANLVPVSNQFIFGVGLGLDIYQDWRVLVESYMAFFESSFAHNLDRDYRSIEVMLGVKHQVSDRFEFGLGLATEGIHGFATADVRGVLNASVTFGSSRASSDVSTGTEQPSSTIVENQSNGVQETEENLPEPERLLEQESREINQNPRVIASAGAVQTENAGQVRDPTSIDTSFLRFKSNSYALIMNQDEELRMSRMIEEIKNSNPSRILIEGHTDSAGQINKNLALSQSRAETIMLILINRGVDRSKIRAIGYGSSKPVASNQSRSGRQKNRRVEVKTIK